MCEIGAFLVAALGGAMFMMAWSAVETLVKTLTNNRAKAHLRRIKLLKLNKKTARYAHLEAGSNILVVYHEQEEIGAKYVTLHGPEEHGISVFKRGEGLGSIHFSRSSGLVPLLKNLERLECWQDNSCLSNPDAPRVQTVIGVLTNGIEIHWSKIARVLSADVEAIWDRSQLKPVLGAKWYGDLRVKE